MSFGSNITEYLLMNKDTPFLLFRCARNEFDEPEQLAVPEWYIGKCRPRVGRDFIMTARGLLTDDIRQDLKNFEGFHFAPHPEIGISPDRLEQLSGIVNRQVRRILE